jgi:hypothetical protein
MLPFADVNVNVFVGVDMFAGAGLPFGKSHPLFAPKFHV